MSIVVAILVACFMAIWSVVVLAVCAIGVVVITLRWLWDCITHALHCLYLALSEETPWGLR